jgi:hypothetical protein
MLRTCCGVAALDLTDPTEDPLEGPRNGTVWRVVDERDGMVIRIGAPFKRIRQMCTSLKTVEGTGTGTGTGTGMGTNTPWFRPAVVFDQSCAVDPVDPYLVQIRVSARVEYEDGSVVIIRGENECDRPAVACPGLLLIKDDADTDTRSHLDWPSRGICTLCNHTVEVEETVLDELSETHVVFYCESCDAMIILKDAPPTQSSQPDLLFVPGMLVVRLEALQTDMHDGSFRGGTIANFTAGYDVNFLVHGRVLFRRLHDCEVYAAVCEDGTVVKLAAY